MRGLSARLFASSDFRRQPRLLEFSSWSQSALPSPLGDHAGHAVGNAEGNETRLYEAVMQECKTWQMQLSSRSSDGCHKTTQHHFDVTTSRPRRFRSGWLMITQRPRMTTPIACRGMNFFPHALLLSVAPFGQSVGSGVEARPTSRLQHLPHCRHGNMNRSSY